MDQPRKLLALINKLGASEAKMKEGDHIGFGMLCILLSICPVLSLIEGNIFIAVALTMALVLGILSYYWINALRARRSWYWESVTRELQGKTLRQMWDTCERGDWLLWFCAHMIGKSGWPTHEQLVLASCQCARLSLTHLKSGDLRPLKAIETAEAWVRGGATLEQVRTLGQHADYMNHDDKAFCAAQAAKSAAWGVYATEDGCCFRLAQAISGAATWSASAAGYELFQMQLDNHDFTPAAAEVREGAEKDILRQCAEIVRRTLTVPNAITNELPLYVWIRRWHRNAQGNATGRMEHIPVAISRSGPSFVVKGNEIDNARLNPVLRMITGLLVVAATWLLIGALAKNPIQYYTTLRWLTCATAAMLVWRGLIQGSLKWAYPLVPVAIVFNPIIPLHLHGTRSDVVGTWQALDVSTAVVLVLAIACMELQVVKETRRRKSDS
jgi:hypothetical protein